MMSVRISALILPLLPPAPPFPPRPLPPPPRYPPPLSAPPPATAPSSPPSSSASVSPRAARSSARFSLRAFMPTAHSWYRARKGSRRSGANPAHCFKLHTDEKEEEPCRAIAGEAVSFCKQTVMAAPGDALPWAAPSAVTSDAITLRLPPHLVSQCCHSGRSTRICSAG